MNVARIFIGSILIVGFVARPQVAEAQSAVPDSIQRELRSALRAAATAQLWYYGTHSAFTTDPEVLRMAPGYRVAAGITVSVQFAENGKGWTMAASHAAAPGETCVYYFRQAGVVPDILTLKNHYKGSTKPGRVVCDFDTQT